MNGPAPLEVRSLRKAYRKRPVISDLNLQVSAGEAVAVLGPNGAGKSTFLGCITADRLPDNGDVRICGIDPFSDLPSAARCMGFVPEQPFLYDELTVTELLDFVISARAIPRERGSSEKGRLLELLGLSGAESLLCRELSQGMGRKVALVCALIHDPRLIILDEAFNGLDATSSERLRAELDRRRKEDGASILLSSHDLTFVGEWCGRGLLLGQGGRWRMLEGDEWNEWRRAPELVVVDS